MGQIRGMYNATASQEMLVNYGFRLPSAFGQPPAASEDESHVHQIVCGWLRRAIMKMIRRIPLAIEQTIRPTGLGIVETVQPCGIDDLPGRN